MEAQAAVAQRSMSMPDTTERREYYARVRAVRGQDSAAVLIAAVNRELINRPAV